VANIPTAVTAVLAEPVQLITSRAYNSVIGAEGNTQLTAW